MAAGKKRNILIEFTGRKLTTDEADSVRELAASLNPKIHLVMPDPWRYLEARSLAMTKADKLIEALRALPNLRFREMAQ